MLMMAKGEYLFALIFISVFSLKLGYSNYIILPTNVIASYLILGYN